MAKYLLDTNHLSAAVDDRGGVRQRLYERHRSGSVFATCVPVLCELETGFHVTKRRDHNRFLLARLLRHVRIWPLDPALATIYAQVFHELRAAGRVLSPVDMALAAMCRTQKAILLTTDRDFEALPDISTENWLN